MYIYHTCLSGYIQKLNADSLTTHPEKKTPHAVSSNHHPKYFSKSSWRCRTRLSYFDNRCANLLYFHPKVSSRMRYVYAKTLASNNPGRLRLKKYSSVPSKVERAPNALSASASRSWTSMYSEYLRSSSRAACCSWTASAVCTTDAEVVASTYRFRATSLKLCSLRYS